MIVEVISRQIGERGGGERAPGDALLRQRVARHFHRDQLRARVRHLRQQLLQLV